VLIFDLLPFKIPNMEYIGYLIVLPQKTFENALFFC